MKFRHRGIIGNVELKTDVEFAKNFNTKSGQFAI